MLVGGDYSYYDPILDWKAHTWQFAFIKASEGTVEDMDFKVQWSAAKGHIIRSAYHFFRPFVDPIKSIDKFLSILGNDPGELPPVLDLEVDDEMPDVAERGLKWLGRARSRTGRIPIVYTSKGFSDSNLLQRFPEYGDYPCWKAEYPWDTIFPGWTEANRSAKIAEILAKPELYRWPSAFGPWKQPPDFVQWTGKCPPEYVPGYPLGSKKAVDVNFYRYDLPTLIQKYKISFIPGDNEMANKPITWRTTLKAGAVSNFRNAPGTVGTGIKRPLTGPLTLEGTGTKVARDNFQWGEVVTINGQPDSGWIAFTTSYNWVEWLEDSPPDAPVLPQQRKAIGSRIYYSEGPPDELGIVPK